MNPVELGPENDCAGEAQQQRHIKKPQLSDSNENLGMGPRWVADSKIDWPTNRRSKHNFSVSFRESELVENCCC
jgi:hypothetical protein